MIVNRVPSDIVRKLGRWDSDAFDWYIRTHPALLSSVIHSIHDPNQLPQGFLSAVQSTARAFDSLTESLLRYGDSLNRLSEGRESNSATNANPYRIPQQDQLLPAIRF